MLLLSTHFKGMNKFRGMITTLFLFFWLITLSHEIVSTAGDGGKSDVEEKPSATDTVRDIYSLITRSSISSWDKIKSLINEVQKQFFPPDLDFRKIGAQSDGGGGGGAGEKMKGAAEKSFKSSKVTVEESAKSAAKVVGEAVHKTTEKVKESVFETDGDYSHEEL